MRFGRIMAMCMAVTITGAATNLKETVVAIPTSSINIIIPVDANLDITDDMELQTNIKIRYAKKLARKAEKKRLVQLVRKKKQREKYIYNIVANPDNVAIPTGLEEADFKYLTAGTWWAGNEWILVDLEARYGINAIFCMAVSTLESDSGTSRFAKEEKNFYGLHTGIIYDSLYANTLDWARRIRDYYLEEGRISVWSIGPKYCPPNRQWEVLMAEDMINRRKQLIINLLDTLN